MRQQSERVEVEVEAEVEVEEEVEEEGGGPSLALLQTVIIEEDTGIWDQLTEPSGLSTLQCIDIFTISS